MWRASPVSSSGRKRVRSVIRVMLAATEVVDSPADNRARNVFFIRDILPYRGIRNHDVNAKHTLPAVENESMNRSLVIPNLKKV